MVIEETWGEPGQEVERFFAQCASSIIDFAERHNLRIEKYRHNAPRWETTFRHPKGEACSIRIWREDDANVRILGTWWLDDPRSLNRLCKFSPDMFSAIEARTLSERIEAVFRSIVQWRVEEMAVLGESPNAGMHERAIADVQDYPIPVL